MHNGTTRFVTTVIALAAMALPAPAQIEPLEWPREIVAPKATLVVYQPQLETFDGNRLTARSAVSVTPTGTTEPIFGAVWFAAKVSTDRDDRTVRLLDVEVSDAKLPNATPEQLERLGDLLETNIRGWDPVISLDRILAGLALADLERKAADDLRMTPPNIVIMTHPAALVSIEGEPEMRPIEGTRLMKVVNTPSLLVFEPLSRFYYLWDGSGWLMTQELKGSWVRADDLPSEVKTLVPEEKATESGTVPPAPDSNTLPARMPQIIVATEPTELVVLDGAPKLTSIETTGLLFVSNTKSHLFIEIESQKYFVVLAGRWYESLSLQGPWTSVQSEDLPADFARIPPGTPKEEVLALVAGTVQATEAVHETYIPQTMAIDRNTVTVEVTYDGKAQFEPIGGTTMAYATNTSSSVIRVDGRYYCCNQAVWYHADAPVGPWVVCTSVPKVIYTIPPSCPVYNVKYVYVYDSTPNVVYVGYTPGYVGCYAYGGTVVFGTGYVYRGWYGAVYYPRPATWGFSFHYSSHTGSWGVGVGYGYPHGVAVGYRGGVAIGYHGAAAWGPRGAVVVGPHGGVAVARRGWWGPAGYRGYSGAGDIDINRSITTPRGTYTGSLEVSRDRDGDVDIDRTITTPDGKSLARETKIDRDWDGDVDIERRSSVSGTENLYNRRENAQRNIESRRGDLAARGDGSRTGDGTIRDRAGERQGQLRDRTGQAGRAVDSRSRGSTGRTNNLFADGDGNTFRRNADGGWDRRENGRWSHTETPGGRTGDRARGTGDRTARGTGDRARSADKRTGRSTTGQRSTRQRSAQRGNLERQHQARQRGSQRTRSYQGSRGSRSGSRGGARSGGRGGGRRR